ncbi:hypothetical protein ACSLOX_27350, partial [Escherichia coli]|uniref:hypothetical protein n=1 Tax=Escherichia coli TaxID=562 RepID=UPI003EE09C43
PTAWAAGSASRRNWMPNLLPTLWGFYRVNDSRVYPGAMVEETGSCITESATTVSRCDVCNVSQIMAQDVVMWQSGTQDILSE